MDTENYLVSLLNGSYSDGKYSVVYLWHPNGGTISVDSTYSTIYVSTSEYKTQVSGETANDIFICACTNSIDDNNYITIDNIGSTTGDILLGIDDGYSLLRIDISHIPVNKKIVIIDPPNTDPTFNYDMQLQGHLHLCGYCSNVCPLSPTYNNLQITSNCTSANMANYVDYISYIPNGEFTNVTEGYYPLVKDCKVDLLNYGTQQIGYNNSNIGEIPIKCKNNATVRYNKSGKLNNSHPNVIEAFDLPDIDIRLLSNKCDAKLDPTWFYTSTTSDSGVWNLSTVTTCLDKCLKCYTDIMNGTK